MKLAVLALFVILPIAALAQKPKTIESECEYQANTMRRVLVIQQQGVARGMAFLAGLNALEKDGRRSQAWLDWLTYTVDFVYDQPNSGSISGEMLRAEYLGGCLMHPEKMLIDQGARR